MNKSYRLMLLSVLTLTGTNYANAQSQMGQTGNVPQFLPTGGWSVNKTVLSEVRGLQDVNLPCMMAASYDNGYSVRFSGAGNKIMAMAIDFRQDVFTQGRKYPAGIRIDDNYMRNISATAFSKSVLIFNMRDVEGFYNAISDAVKMSLSIEGNDMMFALGGINSAMSDLSVCSNGSDAPSSAGNSMRQASVPQGTMQHMGEPMGMPMGQASDNKIGDPIIWNDKVTPLSAQTAKADKKDQMTASMIWEAKAGDDMKSTLEGWASRAGIDIDWQASGNATVTDDVRVAGTFEDAVQTLLARNAAAMGLDANLKNSNTSLARVSNTPQQLLPSSMGMTSEPQTMSSSSTGGKWSAPVGSSLQQVLTTWSKQAGVELEWQANQGFAVRLPVSLNGSYEQALEEILNQYSDEKVRPNAQLNNDPVTGRRTLFVQSSRV